MTLEPSASTTLDRQSNVRLAATSQSQPGIRLLGFLLKSNDVEPRQTIMRREFLGGIVAAGTALGCYSTARDGSRPSPACMEAEKIIVENNTDEPVQIRGGQARLGMAPRGRSEIMLPPNVPSNSKYSAEGLSGAFKQVVYGSTPAAGKVWVTTQCPKG